MNKKPSSKTMNKHFLYELKYRLKKSLTAIKIVDLKLLMQQKDFDLFPKNRLYSVQMQEYLNWLKNYILIENFDPTYYDKYYKLIIDRFLKVQKIISSTDNKDIANSILDYLRESTPTVLIIICNLYLQNNESKLFIKQTLAYHKAIYDFYKDKYSISRIPPIISKNLLQKILDDIKIEFLQKKKKKTR